MPVRAGALTTRSLGVPDLPAELGGLHDWAAMVRAFEPCIVAGMSDREAWEAALTDTDRLDAFRAVYGNRPKPKPRQPRAPVAEPLEAPEVAGPAVVEVQLSFGGV